MKACLFFSVFSCYGRDAVPPTKAKSFIPALNLGQESFGGTYNCPLSLLSPVLNLWLLDLPIDSITYTSLFQQEQSNTHTHTHTHIHTPLPHYLRSLSREWDSEVKYCTLAAWSPPTYSDRKFGTWPWLLDWEVPPKHLLCQVKSKFLSLEWET